MGAEWQAVEFGELTENYDSLRIPVKKVDRKQGPYPYYGASGVVDHVDGYIFDGEYLLISEDGENLRSRRSPIAFLGTGKFWVNNHAHIVRGSRRADTRFLLYAFSRLDVSGYLTGSTRPKLTQGSLNKISLLIPPLPEQRAIAHILGTLDDKIELNRRMNETLEAMARALFKSWFVDFSPVRAKMEGRDTGLPPHIAELFPDRLVPSELGEIPEGWKVNTLGRMCHKPQYGYTASAEESSVGPKFLRIKDINKSAWIRWEDVPYCQIDDDQLDKYQVQVGDVLIARMADPGHGVVIEKHPDAVFASYLIRFQPIHENYVRYIQFWMRSNSYWELVKARGTGTTRRSLNAKVLSKFPAVVPSNAVLDFFTSQTESFRGRVVANTEESSSLANMRDALLPKLMSGELRVRDAESFLERAL